MTGRKRLLLTLACLSFLTIFSCTTGPFSGTTKITDILASPSKYADGIVRVSGRVTESIIFLGQGYFMLSDGTGAIAVIPAKTYPKVGDNVKINGRVKNAFVIGDKSLTVIVEDTGGK